jgi:hypothetical protein
MGKPYYFRFSDEVPKEDIPSATLVGAVLAYINIPEIDPSSEDGNIRILASDFQFPENTIASSDQVVTFTNNSIYSDTPNILLTNIYNNTNDITTLTPINRTVEVRPLWYKYTFLSIAPISPKPNGSYEIRIFDNKWNLMPEERHKIDSNKEFYTDLINTSDTYYWVVYLSEGIEVKKLLSVEPIFKEVTSLTLQDQQQYQASYSEYDQRWIITTNSSSSTSIFSMKTIGNTRISLVHPIEATKLEPWYLQIANGYFRRVYNNQEYEYYIPEYSTQIWNPQYPYKYQQLETVNFIDNNLIKLKQTPLIPETENIVNKIKIYIRKSTSRTDTINELINNAGLILDTENDGPFIDNTDSTYWWQAIVEDYDRNTGYIKISGIQPPPGSHYTIPDTDNMLFANDAIYAFYYHQEDEYVFTELNLNPILDRSLTKCGISIYIKPARGTGNSGRFVTDKTIHYIRFNEDDYCEEYGVTIDEFFAQSDNTGDITDHATYLELGRIYVRNIAVLRDITDGNIVDARIRGGLLKDPVSDTIRNLLQSNSNGLYDLRYWDSAVWPTNSVVVIRLPDFLLNDNWENTGTALAGDDLTNRLTDIRNICKKHLAIGVLPIVRFYNSTTGIMTSIKPPIDRRF